MLAGERGETLEQKTSRHISECIEDIKGFVNELSRDKTQANPRHKAYCETMIKILQNTVDELLKEMERYS